MCGQTEREKVYKSRIKKTGSKDYEELAIGF